MKGLISAIRTLTILPVPGGEHDDLAGSLPWFPVVGLILGVILFNAGRLWTALPSVQWPAAGAFLMLCLDIWLTRGLHMDGLADWADSIGGHGRERRLAIMKDVSLGAFGVLAIVLALIIKWMVFERLLVSGTTLWLIPVWVVSRDMLVELQTTLPYARAEGGMAGPFVTGASGRHRLISHVLTLVLCVYFGLVGLGLYVSAWVITRILACGWRRQFGGITGDLLGTSNEMLEILYLFILALPGKAILGYMGWGWVF